MKIVIATSNNDKIREIKELLPKNISVLLPKDFGIEKFEVIEDGESLKENAFKKAKTLYNIIKNPVIADDTGLFVKSLNGLPGVHSHRYAGENPTYKENRQKILNQLEKKLDRSAYFMTLICYIDSSGKDYYFFGKINGNIINEELGENEFGYDQIFMPENSKLTFGQMSDKEKNIYSHRSIAIKKFVEFMKEK